MANPSTSTTTSTQPHRSMVEEGIRVKASSSFEICFPASSPQHMPTSRLPTLNVTHGNIERHAKTRVNSARNTIQNPEQRRENKLKSLTFTAKKFSALNVAL